MRKAGHRDSTVQTCVRALKGLARRTNLLDTESVKSYLANAELSENRKTKLLEDVSRFYTYLKIPFSRPRYKRIETLPYIPLESEIASSPSESEQNPMTYPKGIRTVRLPPSCR
jgi:hypothetical protein